MPPRRLIVAALRAELAGGWGLLLIVLVLTGMRLAPLLLSLALRRGQERFRLLVRVPMDGLDFGLLLIGAERSVIVHGGDLRLGAFVNFLHLCLLIIG